MGFDFAIIGGGLTAVAMLSQLVNRVQEKMEKRRIDPADIGIHIYEKKDAFGPGYPHSDQYVLPFHITNMCASDMGILEERPDDFQVWVSGNSNRLQKNFPGFRTFLSELRESRQDCNHYPRAIMGEYLKARFQEMVGSARQLGLAVNLYPSTEVVDLREDDDRIRLTIKDLSSEKLFPAEMDRALLATGHWFEKTDGDGYFSSPWPAKKLLRKIPPNEKIAVIGTSLSAIETLLTLISDGKFDRSGSGELRFTPSANARKFALYSRRGLLPKVRGKLGNYKNRFFNRENLNHLLEKNQKALTLAGIFNLLNSELENAYGQGIDWEEILNPSGDPADLLQGYLDDAINGDGPGGEIIWQTVLYQSFDLVRDVYLNLKLEERKRFDRNYTSVFFTHAASQPVINAEKLLALIKAEIVDVIKLGEHYQLVKNEVSGYYELIYRDTHGNLKRDAYRYVVNARGQEKSLETNPSPLAQKLLQRGTVMIEEFQPVDSAGDPANSRQTYKTGSIWIDPKTHHIMQMESDRKVTRSNRIYAVGAMTRGQIIDASMARGIVQATSRIADDLTDHLAQNRHE
jgi:uncharacterized NAD(P)/FAD-binding protein YdhS